MKYVQGKRVELLFIDIHFMGSKLRHFVNCMGKCKIEMYFLLNDHSLDCRKARKCAMNYCNFLNFA